MAAQKGNQLAKGNKGNRDNPKVVKYRDTYPTQMVDFFVNFNIKKNKKLPTFLGFAQSVGVWDTTLDDWRKKYPDFDVAYLQCKSIYKERFINLGLFTKVSAPIWIFIAKNTTDMKDKTETDITSLGKSLGVVVLPPRKE